MLHVSPGTGETAATPVAVVDSARRIVQARNALNQLVDVRLAKTFRFGKHSFEGMFDLFNVTNS